MYKENEGEYIRDHPEEYVLFETGGPTGITATFYETKEELRNATAKYKGQFGVGLLVLYVFLLGLGTIGEIWEIEWILDLPLFRPPGKY